MNAIHEALRRDLDQLTHTTASRPAARARWSIFRGHLHFHLAGTVVTHAAQRPACLN